MHRKITLPAQIARKETGPQIPEPVPGRANIAGQSDGRRRGVVVTDGDPSSKILSRAEIAEIMAKCRQYALSLSPYAIKVIAEATRSRDPRLTLSAAIRICEIGGVLPGGGKEQVLDTAGEAEWQEEQRLVTLGLIMDLMLKKSDLYKMPLPPEFAKDMKELNDRVQELAAQLESEEEAAPFTCRVGRSRASSPK